MKVKTKPTRIRMKYFVLCRLKSIFIYVIYLTEIK